MLTPTDERVRKSDTRQISRAKADDERHRLHAEAASDMASASTYFSRWVASYLVPTIPALSKREQVLRQIVWPLVSNELVDDISDSCAAVHYAQDRFIAVEMRDDKLQSDAESYLEEIDLDGFVSRNCHTALFSAPNSLVVVDLPQEQVSDFPRPYMYLLGSENINRAEPLTGSNESGLLSFAYFDTDNKNRRGLFDDTDFAVYEKKSGTEWVEVFRAAHNIGFCPAFKLWSDIDSKNPLCSNTVLRPVLGLLDRYVFWDASKESGDLAAAHQMFWHLKAEDCSYRTADGYVCQHGIIETPILDNFGGPIANMAPLRETCPVKHICPNHNKYGPGTTIPIPAPQNKDEADWRLPAGWIAADVPNLEYVTEKVNTLRAKILSTTTGEQSSPANKAALNESQIMSILESARQVGQYLADHFETLHRRLIDCLLTLRYGDSYLGCTVNYGRRFALLGGDQLQVLYQSAQDSGSLWLLEEIDNQIQDFYARADASRRLRYRILTDLNPYPYQSAETLITSQQNTINPEGFAIATNLMGFVKRFEREQNGPLERFGILTDYEKRVQTITEIFKSYVTEQVTSRPKPVPANAGGAGFDPASGGQPAGTNPAA